MDNMEGDFSRMYKEQLRKSRNDDFDSIVKWIEENGFTKRDMGGCLRVMRSHNETIDIYPNMKVSFNSSRKRYQYNIDGLKKRLLENR
jgi:hypothetical protein